MTEHLELSRLSGIDVVFVAPGIRSGSATERRTIMFAPGEQIPRVGECVILAFAGDAQRWQVQDGPTSSRTPRTASRSS